MKKIIYFSFIILIHACNSGNNPEKSLKPAPIKELNETKKNDTLKTNLHSNKTPKAFEVYDPKPYDPFNEGDTLKIGSLKEIEMSGINLQKEKSIFSNYPVMAIAKIISDNEFNEFPDKILSELKSKINLGLLDGFIISGDIVCFKIKKTYGRTILDKYQYDKELYMVLLDDGFISEYIKLKTNNHKEDINLPYLSCYYFIFTEKENGDFEFQEYGAAG